MLNSAHFSFKPQRGKFTRYPPYKYHLSRPCFKPQRGKFTRGLAP